MKPNRRFLTQHRFQRLILWTLAVLTWIASILANTRIVGPRHRRQRFDISLPWLTQIVGELLIVRAGRLARLRRNKPIRYWRRGRDLRRRHFMRSILGSKLRRALRHKHTATWIANLIAVLRNLDAHATQLARRMRRGLTRLWRTWTRIDRAAHILGAPAPSPAFSDSS
jgi:hypothetical protein